MGLLFGRRDSVEETVVRELRLPPVWHDARSTGGVDVSGDGSLQSIAVRASIDLICSLVSEMPCHTYRGDGSAQVQIKTPSNLEDPGDDGMGLEDWIYQLVQSWLYRGNSFAEETAFATNGQARQMALLHPDDVSYDSVGTRWLVKGKPPTRPFRHMRVNPVPGRTLGLSPIQVHALQIGGALAATRYGAQWFADSAHPSALLRNTEVPLTSKVSLPDGSVTTEAEVSKRRWMSARRGNREPAILGKGWEYQQIQVNPEESQFLQTMGYTEAQCARLFGPAVAEVLGYESGGSMTYANVVDRRSDLLVFTVNKWAKRAERVLTSLTSSPTFVRFDRDALLESTTLARYQAHALASGTAAWKSINEIRADEDMPPVPWGDEPAPTAPAVPTPEAAPSGGVPV